MPNFCSNRLVVTGPAPEIKRFKEAATGYRIYDVLPTRKDQKYTEGDLKQWELVKKYTTHPPCILCFANFTPYPKKVLKTGYSNSKSKMDAHKWEMIHWGCKHGAYDVELGVDKPKRLEYYYTTSWDPAFNVFHIIAQKFPELKFQLWYDEPGNGIKGRGKWEGGECIEDTNLSKD